ncbi:MAG TPA: hypothetical protein VIT65_02005, partial [Microlunatus sp.]
ASLARYERDAPVENLDGGLTGVLVLVQACAGPQRDQGLPKDVFVASVDGVGAATAGGCQRDAQVLADQRGQ